MDLFKLVGKIVVDNDEANKKIKDTANEANSESGKIEKAFSRIGTALKSAFTSNKPQEFSGDLQSLTGTIDRQENYLKQLKEEYKSLYLQQGKNSTEAQECANKIEKLSNELNANKSKLKEAEKAADEFDKALDDAGDSADDAGGKIGEVLKTIGGAVVGAFAVDKIKDFGAKCIEISDSSANALNGFAASTGVAKDGLQEYEGVMLSIYKNNFGESFEDIAGAMATIKQQAGDMGADELETMTTHAIMLRDTFDFEVNESFRAAKMLTDQFGISGEQAYNLIAQGAQSGLDKNGDLLDSINEYAVHYEQLGFTAEDFFNSLANGTAAGTFSVDKLGDAMKEFGIRAKDGSDSSKEAFQALGLDADKMFQQFNEGGEGAKQATQEVIEKLLEMPPGVEQTTAGVALFGTMWEDLGAEGIAALGQLNGGIDLSKDKLSEINAVKYDSFGAAMSGLGRTIETNLLLPLGDKLIPVIEGAVNKINEFGTWCKENETAVTIISIAVGTFAAALAAYNIALNATTIGTTIATAATTAFGAVMAFVTSPITLVVVAIGALIAIGVLLYKNWDTIKGKAVELWSNLTSQFEAIKTAVTEKVSALWDGIKQFFASGIEWVKSNWQSILAFLINPFAGLFSYLYNNNAKFREWVDKAVSFVKELPGKVWTWLKNTIDKVTNWASQMTDKAKTAASNFINKVVEFFKQLPEKVWTWLTNVISKVTSWAATMASSARTAASNFLNNVVKKDI